MNIKNTFSELYDKRIPFCSCIIAAAGSSRRMNGSDKLFCSINGRPILCYSIDVMNQSKLVSEIIIATRENCIERVANLVASCSVNKPLKVIIGGNSRTESVFKASMECSQNAEFIAVHDGARPLVTPSDVDAIIRFAYKTNACAPAVPVSDTIKIASIDGIVDSTPDRKSLYAVQTPQVFQANILKAALKVALSSTEPVTDDCSAVEKIGKQVYLTDGNRDNIKITVPNDILIAESILNARK